ncbi:PfkB family carbohydrate kinase [Metabacillus litoralis]|uniref:PfkB family carbohydrate kinase n=1 Tax=Metabacillus litoralis TaxID=152268 RepID=UPI00203D8889|nr:PfkB family carbohydrate kinase [Metabacillus litoralis]MCM3654486.1 PfkB family carbohydrate kinase [Metabacillus litoralis]
MLGGKAQQTYFSIMDLAKEKGIFLSFDPNFREYLWEGGEKEFIELTKQAISKADLVKVSEEELKLISGLNDIEEGVGYLHQVGANVVTVTLGKNGTFVSNGTKQTIIPSISIKSVDSTGALLYQISNEEEPANFQSDFTMQKEMISISNKVGAITCTKIGAISALPSLEEIL